MANLYNSAKEGVDANDVPSFSTQDKGLRFWQKTSHAVIENSSVPADCVNRVTSEKGERTLFERLSTPRPARKIVLKSAWQQQQDTSESTSASTSKLVQREEQGNPTDNQEVLSVRKLKRSTESLVEKEESEFKVDLRTEGNCTRCGLGR